MEKLPVDGYLKFRTNQLQEVRSYYGVEKLEILNQSLDTLESWAKKQNHFVVKEFERPYLERAFMSTKGSVDKAKKQIDTQCTLRTLMSKYFVDSIPKQDEALLKKITIMPFPESTNNNERIFLTKFDDLDINSSVYLFFCRLNVLILEYLRRNDYSSGYIVIYDLRNLNVFSLLSNLSLSDLKNIQAIFVDAYGARLPQIHILTSLKVVDILFSTLKQVLSPKITSRIQVSTDFMILHKFIDKDLLPLEYGGNGRSIHSVYEEFLNEITSEDHKKYMKKINHVRTDESLRLTDKFNELYMGIPGTFRTITVD